MKLTFDAYQEMASDTAVYPERHKVVYPIIGLVGEAGELANKIKKVLRDKDGVIDDDARQALVAELGDVLWYLSAVATDLGVHLRHVADANLAKLAERKARGTLQGSGDNR